MKLKHLKITNCCRISDIDIEMRDNVVLIGPNGSGKTTVLQCLDMLLGMDSQTLRKLVAQDFIRDESQPLIVEATLEVLDANELAAFANEVNITDENSFTIRLEALVKDDSVAITQSFPVNSTKLEPSNVQRNAFGWMLLQPDASSQTAERSQEKPPASKAQQATKTSKANQGQPMPHKRAADAHSPSAQAIYDLLNMGASIVAIDEPEAHLHPASQRSLAKTLKASSGQKILVTHSPTIAGSFEPDEIVVIRADGTAAQSRRDFLSGDAGMLARWWIGRQLEPLTAGAVIAVEGPSDRVIVDSVAKALGFDLDSHDIVIMETNGCGDMKVVESIFGCGGFDIPLFELIDEDAMDDAAKRLDVNPADLETRDVYVSSRDLEDEYVRAIGAKRLWTRMKEAKTFTRNVLSLCIVGPDGIPTETHLAEFIRSKSNRKIPSALLAAQLLDATNAPNVESVAKLLKAAWS